ncbi:MAG: hypothetical protein CSA22_01730 [Deltaproteobacteria bacterium]|nr:MAG: hypothetical protein CSA22_01730 [Deltaproteobacteria bacterium]
MKQTKRLVGVILLGCMVVGCGKDTDTRKTADTVVEDVTGYTTYKQGERVKEKLENLELQQLERIKAADQIADE